MLTGERIVLRAKNRADVEAEHAQLADDYALHAVTDISPWEPKPLDAAQAQYDKKLAEPPNPSAVWFSVARKDDPDLAWVGHAGLWSLQEYQRTAHVGITLAPAARGQGLGRDVVRVLCDYAFRIRGLHRLTLETLATNEGMLRAARAAGFVEEGRLREEAFVLGGRVDEVKLGLLATEFRS